MADAVDKEVVGVLREILAEIRDGFRDTNEGIRETNTRLDRVTARLDKTNEILTSELTAVRGGLIAINHYVADVGTSAETLRSTQTRPRVASSSA